MNMQLNDKANPIKTQQPLFTITAEGVFFKTREGHDFGPYENLKQAKIVRKLFIHSLTRKKLASIHLLSKKYQHLFRVEEITLGSLKNEAKVA